MGLAGIVQEKFPQWVIATHCYRGNETVIIKREGLLEVCHFLRDDPQMAFNFLMDLTCVDYLTFGKRLESAPSLSTPSPLPYFMKPKPVAETWERLPESGYRFEVVYHLYCHERHERLRLKCRLRGEHPVIASVTPVWSAANWYEREVFDLFGIRFEGHPHLRRLLMPDDWQGHPLRKDYPVTGYR